MGKKILIVEDDKFLRDVIAKKLVKEGYVIIEAMNGEEGLLKIKEDKPDLILLDLILPGMDGFEFLELIKKNQENSQIPVVILSNLGQRDEMKRGFELGAIDYLVKAHFSPSEVVKKVKDVLK